MLCAYVSKWKTNWEEYLPILELAYNSSKHLAMGYSPFMLMYGFQPQAPMDVGLKKEKLGKVKDFLQNFNEILKIAKANVRRAIDIMLVVMVLLQKGIKFI